MAGNGSTLPITLDQMIYHATSVVRAINRALVVVDMPFGTYQGNSKEALCSAIRIMKETGAHAVKMEGGSEIMNRSADIISRDPGNGASRINAAINSQIRNICRKGNRRRRSK
jgi:3-methyl-2-oxobutanoate hydroxymethyltransferase